MCGRYRIDDGRDSIELHGIIEAVNRRVVVEPVVTGGDVLPTNVAPVVARSKSRKMAAFGMRWGYHLPDGKYVINARSETAADRPLFRDGMRERRCLVPATRYYEWERRGGAKVKYTLWPERAEMFYMAGIYRLEAEGPAFAILTRDPADHIAFIHDRMPVILPSDAARDWLDPACDTARLLERAVLSVAYEKEAGDEQLRMF